MNKTNWKNYGKTTSSANGNSGVNKNLCETFKANSLDSLANSSHHSESLSEESQDSDSGGDATSKVGGTTFQVKCEVYSQDACGSTRSWTKSESSSETSYEYVTSEYLGTENRCDGKVCSDKRCDSSLRMETIPEEYEPKVSVKEILARFENLKNEKQRLHEAKNKADKNNNNFVGVVENKNLNNNKINNNNNNKIINNVISKPKKDSSKKNEAVIIKEHHKKAVVVNNNKDCKSHQSAAALAVEKLPPNVISNNNKSQKLEPKVYSPTTSVLELLVTHQGSDLMGQKVAVGAKDIISDKDVSVDQGSSSRSISASGSCSAASSLSGVSSAEFGVGSAEKEIQAKSQQRSRSPVMDRLDIVPNNLSPKSREEASPTRLISRDESRDGARSPSSPLPPTGKYSLMQFAMQNFRQLADVDHQRMDQPHPKSKNKSKDWTWKQQTDVIKWQGTPVDGPLLRMDDPELTPLAIECFDCILRYCGDQPLTPEMSEVKCVYTVLMHCHKYALLRDEVYCQLMKQTTSNKSESPESSQRAWRLLSIVAAYFACSDNVLPYLMEHLSSAANDRRRVCHGTAAVCVTNLRKTQRCGGRKNVPSVEEVTAVSAGRSARRQIYRLPGGAERVVNTRCSTVVADVIQELCSLIGIAGDQEQQEFSLYCIVQGDAFTMPLAADEYILDVTTELHKAAQPFYLIFCRSVWYHPLKHDASPLYTEVLFNQVAPDYLEGLLLRLGNPNLPPSVVRDMALVASLLHRAADLAHAPSLKEVKFLLPKPVLGLREPRPPQWLALVQTSWGQAAGLSVSRAKHRVLQVLSSWPLFGSSFFAVKRVVGEPEHWQEHILALNRGGVHFLDMTTHETLQHWPFAEVISTRKVRSEDGALFLDMKCGNLLQQRVTRLQTEQAHEISRLVRQYINLEQEHSDRNNK